MAEPLARGSLLAIRSKISVLALAGRLGLAEGDALAIPGTIEAQFLAGISVALFSQPGTLADAFRIVVGYG